MCIRDRFNLKSYQEDAKSEVSLVRGKVSVGIKAVSYTHLSPRNPVPRPSAQTTL